MKVCARNVLKIWLFHKMYCQIQQKEKIRKRLNRIARTAVLVIGMTCFISMATGVTLQLHLLSYEHPEEHDHENCPICASLLIHSNKFIQYPDIQIQYFDSLEPNPFYPACTRLVTNYFKAFDPRPPPLFL